MKFLDLFAGIVLESCCLEWYQNMVLVVSVYGNVLESCCLEWYQNV